MRVDSGGRELTTNHGVPVADNQNSLKAGLRGPALLEDFILREKITHFDHERIPERVVHARGSGAHGFFECYEALTDLTRASIFAEAGKRTPVFVRFSTVAGERGSTDTARDVRGFAVKFYTDEGNWDLVGNNIPVFFIQDAMKFPDVIHAVKPEPHHGMPQAASAHDTFWDFVSLMPETTHMLMWVMSDRAIPRSYRMMQGFGVHSFRFVNEAGKSRFVKFHWNPAAGTHSLAWDEAVKISGADPDFHRRDLWEAIEAGAYPEYELAVQVFSEEDAERFSFDVLDATKLIPEEIVPLRPIGRMVLNRNPDNFFAETEQVAFCTAHIVPGLDFSNDPLLAGRIHSYVDTQISRLGGPNFHEIPINAPIAQAHNNQRDGMHRQAIARGRVAYEPNSLGGGCPFQAGAAGFTSFLQPADGDKVRGKPEKFAEHYNQATLFWESQSEVEKRHIIGAYRFELTKVQVAAVRERVVSQLRNVSEVLAKAVADGLGMGLPEAMPKALARAPKAEVKSSPALSLLARPGSEGIKMRRIAILVADGVDGEAATADPRGARRRGRRTAFCRDQARSGGRQERRFARSRSLAGNRAGGRMGRDDRSRRRGRDACALTERAHKGVSQGSVPPLQADTAHGVRRGAARGDRDSAYAAVGRCRSGIASPRRRRHGRRVARVRCFVDTAPSLRPRDRSATGLGYVAGRGRRSCTGTSRTAWSWRAACNTRAAVLPIAPPRACGLRNRSVTPPGWESVLVRTSTSRVAGQAGPVTSTKARCGCRCSRVNTSLSTSDGAEVGLGGNRSRSGAIRTCWPDAPRSGTKTMSRSRSLWRCAEWTRNG